MAWRKAKRAQVGWGGARVARWAGGQPLGIPIRRVGWQIQFNSIRYTRCWMGKGNLSMWLCEIGKEDGEATRTGNTSSSNMRGCRDQRLRGGRSGRRGSIWTTRGGSF